MNDNNPDTKDLTLELVNSLNSKQFDLFLQLYNKLYDSSKNRIDSNLLHKDISQVCYNRLKTDTNIKTKFRNVGGIPIMLCKWWYLRYVK